MRIVVIGGGITGQMVQWVVPSAEVLDWRSVPRVPQYLTRHYGANYLWKPLPGMECRSFRVITHIDGAGATEESIKRYKAKVGKTYENDLTFNLMTTQFRPDTVGYEIANVPLTRVTYNTRITSIDMFKRRLTIASGEPRDYDILVSTIPLYSLMSLVGFPDLGLQFKPIWVKITGRPPEAPFPPDTMYINYLSDPNVAPYRATDRGGERHYESLTMMGVAPNRRIVPGKVYPHEGVADVIEHLAQMNIYCFGRFATWDADELLHETFDDILAWRTAMEHSGAVLERPA